MIKNNHSPPLELLGKFFIFVVVGIFLSSMMTNFVSPIQAATYELTTSSDWNNGTKNEVETHSKEGDLKINADGTWGARNWKSPKLTISVGSSFVSDGTDIYVVRGYGDTYFSKYSPANDSWTELTPLPYGTYYGADMTIIGDYVYVIFGGYQKAFARYSITNNDWEILPDFLDLVYEGGSLTTDGTDIYALRGYYSQDFYKYDVSEEAWGPMAGTPSTTRRGADLVRVGDYIYTPRGYNTTTFYRYDITANTWSTMANVPGTMYDEVEITTDGTSIFVPRQNNTTSFYKYDIASNTWSTLTNAPANSRYAGVVYHSADNYVYFFRGNGQYHFWKYDIAQDEFVGPADTPATIYTGSDLIYHSGYLYGPRGYNQSTFYRFNISSNSWETLTSAPTSFYDDTKGVLAGNYIYFYRGYNTNVFYRYNISGNSWETLATTPSNARFGGTLSYPGSGDYIYGTRGATTRSFWRYSISGNSWDDGAVADLPTDAEASYGSRTISDGTDIYFIAGVGISRMFKYDISEDTWTELARTPFSPYYGTDISYYDGKIIALAGWYKTDAWEYTIATNTWRKLKSLAGYGPTNIGPYAGASIEYDGTSSFYVIRGGVRTEVITYTPGNDYYPSTGTWTSPSIDLDYVSSWTNLTTETTNPDDSSITYQTRSSNDNINWTSWENVSGGIISSAPQRYLQIQATLNAATDLDDTPILHSLAVNYEGDVLAPNNPDTFVGKSQEIGGDELTNGESYTHTHPYFNWSGASDGEQEVAGYYVYFGGNSSADPEIDGSFQTTSDYNVTSALNTGTYYLRIKTKDSADNISSEITGFTYDYIGISPALNLIIDETTEFTGTSDNTNLSSDQIKLTGKTGGFWLEERISLTPGSMQYGAKNVAYVSETNKIYAFRGNNSTTFYEYDIDTDVWTTKAAAPAGVRMGGGVIEGPEGYLYGMRGNNTTSFWRYNISEDSWSDEDAADAPLTVYYGGSMVYDGSQYVYVMRGNNDEAFWRYDTQSNTWETAAQLDFGAITDAVNNRAYLSADLAIDTANQIIYATQGNLRDGFSAYDINTNSWNVLTDLPALPYLGSSIEYDDSTHSVYYMPGYYKDTLYKYDLSSEEWTQMSSAPATFYYGGNIRKAGDFFYAIRGANTTSFYKYNIAKDSWVIPTRGLFGTEFQGSSSLNAYYGGDIVKGDGNNFYLTRGYYASDFIRWNSETGTTTRLTNTPSGAYNGSTLVYDSTNNKIYFTGGVYLQKFYVYDIATNEWTEESSDPPLSNTNYGASMIYDGSRYIYLNIGGNSSALHRFDTQGSAGSKWDTMANAPGGLGYGAELVIKDGYIYTLRGQNVANNPFYRYEISTNTWDNGAVADLDIDVYNDGFLTDGGNGYFYAARGDNDTEFYRYSLAGDAWSSLEDVPANVNEGGSGESNGVNKIFVMPGSGTNTYADGLYTYVMETETSSFEESGSYTSQSHDLTKVYQWANLRVNYTTANNTDLSISTRTSDDDSNWSSWAAVSEEHQVGTNYDYKINSPAARYIQVQFEFASSDGINSGIIGNYTINYFQDTTLPTNPNNDGLTVYSDNTPGDVLSSETWYAHESPYFDWPEAEVTNGASDTNTGSGIAGYYVYFGTDNGADPETEGTYQVDTDFTPTGLVSDSTYYLRVKTRDHAGNVSSDTWAPFIYKYDSDGPDSPANLTADPSGYSATNSFDFSWDAVTATGADISGYCYKTGTESGILASDQCGTETSVASISAYQAGANTFYVRTQDQAGNYSDYTTVSYFYADIDNAPAPPTNLTVTPETNTSNAFAFDWDPPLEGTYYGSESNLSYYYSVNALPTEHSTSKTSLTYLVEGAFATLPGENILYLTTMDEAGNINYNDYTSVAFEANTAAPGIPLNIDIADVSVKATESWKLAVSWEEPSDTGSGVTNYAVYRSIDGENFTKFSTSGGISYVDVDLEQQTYYYKVQACDSTNNCGAFSDVVSLFPDGKFVTPADLIAEPVVSNITTKKATVSWSTNRTCDSKIAYGTTSGEYLEEEVSNSLHVTSHILALTNLSPGTTYYYVTKWTDEDGNTGISEEATFETAPPPSTEEPQAKSLGLDNALIEFTSRNASKVRIYYGETTTFGGTKDVITGSAEGTHTVELSGLKDGTKYFYKINTFDSEGEEYEGETHSFETLPRPKVSDIKINQVKGTAQSTLLVEWTTNTEVSSIITYYPSNYPGEAIDKVEVDLKADRHRMILTGLLPQTSYSLIIKGKDIAGNIASSQVIEVTTFADSRPPQINELKVEGEILGIGDEATAQFLVSFKTDEPSTAQIEYGEGSGTTYSQKTQEDNTLSDHHLVVISGLTPSKVYHIRALSKDKAGNLATSLDKVVITPKATENALDLVIGNMSEVFSFINN